MNVFKLGSIKIATTAKNVRPCLLRKLFHEARAIKEILVESDRDKVDYFNEADN